MHDHDAIRTAARDRHTRAEDGLAACLDVIASRRRWCVIEAACLDVIGLLPDGCADHVIADPPYEAEAHTLQRRVMTGTTAQRRMRDGRAILARPLEFAPMGEAERWTVGAEIARLVRRWALVFCQVEAVPAWRSALAPLGYRRTCVWTKPDAMPQLTGDRPGMGYEAIVCAHPKGRSEWNGGGRRGVFEHVARTQCREADEHPTKKPDALMVDLVELFTDPGDVVLDPYAGSGSTGVAALRLGRRFIGIEKDARWASLARERCAAEADGTTLRAARAGQGLLFGGEAAS